MPRRVPFYPTSPEEFQDRARYSVQDVRRMQKAAKASIAKGHCDEALHLLMGLMQSSGRVRAYRGERGSTVRLRAGLHHAYVKKCVMAKFRK